MNNPTPDMAVRAEELRWLLSRIPRIKLTHLPTPLDECPRLSATLGGPRIFIKRDDLSGLAFGGTKNRMLEFLMADARQQGADVIIAGSPLDSNQPRLAAAAATKIGFKPVLVLWGQKDAAVQGNLLLDYLLGAELRVVEDLDYPTTCGQIFEEIAEEYRQQGYQPYVINLRSPSVPVASLGTVDLALELWDQLQEKQLTPEYVLIASISGATQAGLALGAKLLGLDSKVVGVNLSYPPDYYRRRLADFAKRTAKFLGADVSLSEDEILLDNTYIGQGDSPSEEGIEAIKLMARTEGILLDPGYTGKLLAGLTSLIRQGQIGSDSTVVLVHTGGTPGLFASHELLAVGAEQSIIIHKPNQARGDHEMQ